MRRRRAIALHKWYSRAVCYNNLSLTSKESRMTPRAFARPWLEWGLAAANALTRRGLEFPVFEQPTALGEVGAAVFIYPNTLR
jgi:hypothetical protein